MSDEVTVNGAILTYTVGAVGAAAANLTLNDWLLLLSLALVLIRIPIEIKRLYEAFSKRGGPNVLR